MEQMTKQTETRNANPENYTAQRFVVAIFSVIEIILAFRLVFKLMGANPTSGFVQGIYSVTQFIVGIFEGIFSRVTTTGAETKAVFEPATLIAMVVIALIAWVVLKLMPPRVGTRVEKTEYTQHDNQNN